MVGGPLGLDRGAEETEPAARSRGEGESRDSNGVGTGGDLGGRPGTSRQTRLMADRVHAMGATGPSCAGSGRPGGLLPSSAGPAMVGCGCGGRESSQEPRVESPGAIGDGTSPSERPECSPSERARHVASGLPRKPLGGSATRSVARLRESGCLNQRKARRAIGDGTSLSERPECSASERVRHVAAELPRKPLWVPVTRSWRDPRETVAQLRTRPLRGFRGSRYVAPLGSRSRSPRGRPLRGSSRKPT